MRSCLTSSYSFNYTYISMQQTRNLTLIKLHFVESNSYWKHIVVICGTIDVHWQFSFPIVFHPKLSHHSFVCVVKIARKITITIIVMSVNDIMFLCYECVFVCMCVSLTNISAVNAYMLWLLGSEFWMPERCSFDQWYFDFCNNSV